MRWCTCWTQGTRAAATGCALASTPSPAPTRRTVAPYPATHGTELSIRAVCFFSDVKTSWFKRVSQIQDGRKLLLCLCSALWKSDITVKQPCKVWQGVNWAEFHFKFIWVCSRGIQPLPHYMQPEITWHAYSFTPESRRSVLLWRRTGSSLIWGKQANDDAPFSFSTFVTFAGCAKRNNSLRCLSSRVCVCVCLNAGPSSCSW